MFKHSFYISVNVIIICFLKLKLYLNFGDLGVIPTCLFFFPLSRIISKSDLYDYMASIHVWSFTWEMNGSIRNSL